MKKVLVVAMLCLAITSLFVMGFVAIGPAPNAGDCVPDGSGFESPLQNGNSYGDGPAPNSGDGVPDGSGW